MVVIYHWRELPQVSFLSQQKFCRDKHMFVATKNTSFVATKACLLRKTFVITNTCSSKILSYFCHDKRYVLSWQTHVCRDRHVCCKTVVVTKMILVAVPANVVIDNNKSWVGLHCLTEVWVSHGCYWQKKGGLVFVVIDNRKFGSAKVVIDNGKVSQPSLSFTTGRWVSSD